MRHGDDQWFDIVKWVLFAMINAEELGITQKNVDEMMKSTNPDIKRFVGTEGNYGEQLGLTQGLGGPHHQAGRQLRRGVRTQCRAGLAAEDRPRPEQVVEQGRHPVRAADPLTEFEPIAAAAASGGRTPRGRRQADEG